MLFNSLEFAIFFPIVFILYWFVFNRSIKNQNILVLLASYLFYGWWDWRFLSLIIFSSVLDFFIGIGLTNSQDDRKRKLLVAISIFANIGLLAVFKYFNFFVDNFINAFSFFGIPFQKTSLNIVLPVGISFYTFQTLSYSIDIYRNKIKATKDIIAFFTFVSFFPQLVAGPIERASHLLPQFSKKRSFDLQLASDGMRQILWGFFKKIVIADNCAIIVNDVFAHYSTFSGSALLVGAVYFSFQVYGDFSGYSDIAIGTARLLGFNLQQNFAFPFFSRDIAELWRRWHISLNTWFRDYLYIPLGGSRGSTASKIRNTFIIFIVSGFWHGADWNYIFWGAISGLYFLPLMLTKRNRNYLDVIDMHRILPSFKDFLNMIKTFSLFTFSLIIFRSDTIGSAIEYIINMVIYFPERFKQTLLLLSHPTPFLLMFMFIVEWFNRDKKHGLEIDRLNIRIRWAIYFVVLFFIFVFGNFDKNSFIYFAF